MGIFTRTSPSEDPRLVTPSARRPEKKFLEAPMLPLLFELANQGGNLAASLALNVQKVWEIEDSSSLFDLVNFLAR